VYHGHDASTILVILVEFLGPVGISDVLALADILDHIEACRMVDFLLEEVDIGVVSDTRFYEWVDLLSTWVDDIIFVDSNWFAAGMA
jgi:hypothetical protein